MIHSLDSDLLRFSTIFLTRKFLKKLQNLKGFSFFNQKMGMGTASFYEFIELTKTPSNNSEIEPAVSKIIRL